MKLLAHSRMCKESNPPWYGDKKGEWEGVIIKDSGGAAAAKAVKADSGSY